MMEPLRETGTADPAVSSPVARPPGRPAASRLARVQFLGCLLVTAALLAYLLWPSAGRGPAAAADPDPAQMSPVRLTAEGRIQIEAGSPLHQKLEVTTVEPHKLAAAALTVTGTVVASLRSEKGKGPVWQFASPELLGTYTDWQRALTDIAFARKQLDAIRQLAETRVSSQTALVKRLRKLVEAGTDTERDLAAARTELLQAEIQGRKDIHEAETALRVAQRAEAALVRQLQQAGLEPDLLRLAAAEVDIVVADVPEALMSRVKRGQGCEARFLGLPNRVFAGRVRAISPVLSRERRTLRVLFSIDDPDDQLRPGMFADIGLGTDAREALLVPSAGVVHVGRSDYLLVREGRPTDCRSSSAPLRLSCGWSVAEVQVGELHPSGMVEILAGVRAGQQVVARGAILLKPVMMEAVRRRGGKGRGGA